MYCYKLWYGVLLSMLCVRCLSVGAADVSAPWSEYTQIPGWMIPSLCDGSDRFHLGIFSLVENADCPKGNILINVSIASSKTTSDFEGVRDVLYQLGQLYGNCVMYSGKKSDVWISEKSRKYLSPFVLGLFDRMIPQLGSKIDTPPQGTCYSKVYTLHGVEADPVEWRFTTNRGVLPMHGKYFLDYGVFVRHPKSVSEFGTETLRELAVADKNRWRSTAKTILYVPSKRIHQGNNVQHTIERAAELSAFPDPQSNLVRWRATRAIRYVPLKKEEGERERERANQKQ